MGNSFIFSGVTLLITHFNRSNSLERLLRTCTSSGYRFDEIIVSDDGSSDAHLERLLALKAIYSFRLITSPVNKGLGNNINKAQDEVRTPLILYVQEDFIPCETFGYHFEDALKIINSDQEIDIVRFYSYLLYPALKPYGKGYSEMLFKPWSLNYLKIYCYSDHPHLKRCSFSKKFGRYEEGIPGDRTEYRMCISFIKNKGKGLFYTRYKELFEQQNTESEPSTMHRKSWTQSSNVFIVLIRTIYRQIRYNYDIHF